ncbi:MAG: TolC family protein [Candidatus Omnitrophica bacterium]|nr:TolC family protein [Candidatus Omnitrophota bacterium]
MKKNILIYFLVFFLSLSSTVYKSFGQNNRILKLSLANAVEMALNSSEDFQIKNNTIDKTRFIYKAELSNALPQIESEFSLYNNFQYPDIAATTATRDFDADAKIEVEQALFTFGRISNAVRASLKTIKASEYDRETARQEIIYNTKLAYYSLCLTKKVMEIARESYQHAEKNKEILEMRSLNGRASKHDNLKIASDIASRKPTLNNAITDYYSAMETLKVMIDVDADIELELTEEFNSLSYPFDRDAMAWTLYNNQPAIKALATEVEAKGQLVKAKKAEYYPEISAFASWSHKGSNNTCNLGNDSLRDYGIAGVKVEIPIWTGGETAAELGKARIDKRNAELEYRKGKEYYLLELNKALKEYNGYMKTLEANNDAVKLSAETFSLGQELFRAGQISITDLNDYELSLTNEKLNREFTLFNISMILAKIERLTLWGGTDNE